MITGILLTQFLNSTCQCHIFLIIRYLVVEEVMATSVFISSRISGNGTLFLYIFLHGFLFLSLAQN